MAAHESILEAPRHLVLREMVLPPAAAPARPAEILPPSEEQTLATDEYFAQVAEEPGAEAQAAAGLMGLWAGTLMLHDLAVEHLRGPKDEEEEKPKRLPARPDEPRD
jgi:hypothetical protein